MTNKTVNLHIDDNILEFLCGMFMTMNRNPDVPPEMRRKALLNYETLYKMCNKDQKEAMDMLDKGWMTDRKELLEEGRDMINFAFDRLTNNDKK